MTESIFHLGNSKNRCVVCTTELFFVFSKWEIILSDWVAYSLPIPLYGLYEKHEEMGSLLLQLDCLNLFITYIIRSKWYFDLNLDSNVFFALE